MHKVAEKSKNLRRKMIEVRPFIHTIIHLNQAVIRHRADARRYDLRSLDCPFERTGENMIKSDRLQAPGCLSCLRNTGLIQRLVTSPLKPAKLIHFGLSMTDYINHMFNPTLIFLGTVSVVLQTGSCIFLSIVSDGSHA